MGIFNDEFSSGSGKIDLGGKKSSGLFNSEFKSGSSSVSIREPESRSFFDKVKEKVGGFLGGVVKFGARTGVEALGLGASTIDFAADFLGGTVEKNIREGMPGIAVRPKFATEARSRLADRWKGFYESSIGAGTEKAKQFTESLRGLDFIVPSEEWSNASTLDKFTKKLPETVLNIGPGVVSSLGAFALNPVVGFAVSAGSTADEIKDIAIEGGVEKENAELIGLGTGLLIGWLDKIVPDEVFSPTQKKEFVGSIAKRVVKTGMKEAGTEMVQEDVQLLVESTLRDDLKLDEVVSRTAMSGLGGLLGGTGAQTVQSFANNIRSGDIGGAEIKTVGKKKVVEDEVKLSKKEDVTKRQSISVRDKYEGTKTAVASIKPDGTGSIAIVLENDAQGKGLGSKIVADLEGQLAEKGVTTVALKSFDEAVGFWEKKGYVVSGEEKNGLIPMTKEISKIEKPEIKDLNRPFNEKFTKAVIDKTISGDREKLRLDSAEKIVKNSSGLQGAKPDDTVTVYRAGEGEIGEGNYVTISKERAEDVYMKERDGAVLLQKEVKIADLVRGEGLRTEFVYLPKESIQVEKKPIKVEKKVEKKVDKKAEKKAKKESKKKLKSLAKDEVESKERVKRVLSLESITQEKIKSVKDEKSTRSLLKDVRKDLRETIVEAEALAEIAKAKRDGINTNDVARLKGIIAINKKFQTGDLETIRNSKAGDLLNNVIENVQEVHPNMSESQAFDFAMNLPTKADEKSRTPTIIELEKKEKKLSKFLDQLKERQKKLSIEESNALTDEWIRTLSVQEELVKVIGVRKSQLPVGEGKLKVSRLEARMKDKLGNLNEEEIDELGLSTYRQMNKKENIARASKYVAENTDDAIKVLTGEIEAPDGILINSIFIALRELGAADTEVALKVATFAATRAGQEISILSEIDKESPASMIQDVIKTRIEAFKKKSGRNPNVKIKNEVKKMDNDVTAPSPRQWNSFLEEILC